MTDDDPVAIQIDDALCVGIGVCVETEPDAVVLGDDGVAARRVGAAAAPTSGAPVPPVPVRCYLDPRELRLTRCAQGPASAAWPPGGRPPR